MDDMNVQIAAARIRRTLCHVLPKNLQRAYTNGHERAHVPYERQNGVVPLERVCCGNRFPLLAETAIETADDFTLTKQDDEPLLDLSREPRKVVHLEKLFCGE